MDFAPERIEWEKDEDVSACRNCATTFTVVIRKHHCRGTSPFEHYLTVLACGKIFCGPCSNFFITWDDAPSTDPMRVCRGCLWRHSAMDLSKTFDIFESTGLCFNSLLLNVQARGPLSWFHPSLEIGKIISTPLNTYPSMSICEILPHPIRYERVIAMDLPGLGSRINEKLTLQSAINAIREVIEQNCESKTAILFGYVSLFQEAHLFSAFLWVVIWQCILQVLILKCVKLLFWGTVSQIHLALVGFCLFLCS